jgi:O-antigen ligase
MFSIIGIVLLLVQGYTRPQEFVEAIATVPFLYIFFALALFGLAIDLRLRLSRPIAAPTLGVVVVFALWAIFTVGIRLPSEVVSYATDFAVPLAFYFLVAHGVQSFRGFAIIAGTLLAIVLFLAFVGIHQGSSPRGCIRLDPTATDASGAWDGRACSRPADCDDGGDPEASYECERVGLFGTSTVADGRVRYRGALNDPNELALTMGIGLPFAFAFFERKRSFGRGLLLAVSLVAIAYCTVLTRSRGGQLVFLSVMGVYFVKRYGARGLLIGALFAVPVLLFGGRDSSDAEASSTERIEMMHMALQLFFWYPARGVGMGQILEYNPLTAHNSYALAAAEMGLPGLILWSSVLYLSFKIVVEVLRRYADEPGAAVARTWAMALLASLTGMVVGIFFLSFCYHIVFWVYMGLCGALYQACRARDPDLRVRLDGGDWIKIAAIDVGLIAVIWIYTSLKVG